MKIAFHRPEPAELAFRQALLADAATMSYNHAWGGTVPFPPERWPAWYARWVDADPRERFYRYIRCAETGRFVGEAAYHVEPETGLVLANVIVAAPLRGRGFGGAALERLCACASARGIPAMCDRIALDNPAVALFLAHGFVEVSRDAEAVLLRRNL